MSSKLNSKHDLPGKTRAIISVILKGLGQIMLQENSITGLLFLIGIFYGSIAMGFAALLATVCGTVVAYLLKYDHAEINQGLYGFNAVLCAIVFAGPKVKDGMWVLISLILALVISLLMLKIGIAKLTFPFVLATWLTLFLKNKIFLKKSVACDK
jgi:urea transporter